MEKHEKKSNAALCCRASRMGKPHTLYSPVLAVHWTPSPRTFHENQEYNRIFPGYDKCGFWPLAAVNHKLRTGSAMGWNVWRQLT